jgi:hypothetical protein
MRLMGIVNKLRPSLLAWQRGAGDAQVFAGLRLGAVAIGAIKIAIFQGETSGVSTFAADATTLILVLAVLWGISIAEGGKVAAREAQERARSYDKTIED